MAVAVVDLGVGNTASMLFAIERLGARAVLTHDAATIEAAERVVLPGVGAAGFAMGRIAALGLGPVLRAYSRPLLGVCLGQQLLCERSEEGDVDGLGIIPGVVRRIDPAPGRPVPHMGWNQLKAEREDPLLEGVEDGAFVYFVHSYVCPSGESTLASSDYGAPFASMVRQANVWGCQFHPERSSAPGARILANFLALPC